MKLSRREFLGLGAAAVGAAAIAASPLSSYARPQEGGPEGIFERDEEFVQRTGNELDDYLSMGKSVTHYAYHLLGENESKRFHDVKSVERMVDSAASKTDKFIRSNFRSGADKKDESIIGLYFLNRELHERFSYEENVFDCFDFALPHLALAEKRDLPVYPVTAPNHVFLRFDPDGRHDALSFLSLLIKEENKDDMNFDPKIAPSNNVQIQGKSDQYFIDKYKIPISTIEKGVYLRDLTHLELIGGVFGIIGKDILLGPSPDYESATKNCVRSLSLLPKFPEGLVNLGLVFMRRYKGDNPEERKANFQRDYKKADKCFDAAIGLYPNFAEAYNDKGTLYLDIQNYPEAERLFRKALDIRPDYADAMHNLSRLKS
jgi:tetratricopeptide (TPR) repeat protein